MPSSFGMTSYHSRWEKGQHHALSSRPGRWCRSLPIFFNVDSSVGENGQNSSAEDILLVQFLLHEIAAAAKSSKPGARPTGSGSLKVPMSGANDAATIDGIRAWQEGRKEGMPATIVDGRVNSARGVFYVKGGSGRSWT